MDYTDYEKNRLTTKWKI